MPKSTFTLTNTTKVQATPSKTEGCYHYDCTGHATVSFHSHPTRAFQYVLVSGDRKVASRLINAFVSQGLKQHDYAGGFAEAIKSLTI